MDPYGTFGMGEGIPRKPKPATLPAIPAPSSFGSPVSRDTGFPPAGDAWGGAGGYGEVAQGKKPPATTTRKPSYIPTLRPTHMQDAINIYQSMVPQTTRPSGPAYVHPGVPSEYEQNKAAMGRESAGWSSNVFGQAGGSSQSPAGPAQRPAIPPPQAPDVPAYKAPEYAPPAEDPGAYTRARREAMAPGARSLREGLREAIHGAGNLDNPNAKAKFIGEALQGFGRGLEGVAAGAAREGRAEAGRQRQEQMQIYNAKYKVMESEALTNYENEIGKIAQDYANQVAMASAGIDPAAYGDRQFGSPMSYQSIAMKQAAAAGR